MRQDCSEGCTEVLHVRRRYKVGAQGRPDSAVLGPGCLLVIRHQPVVEESATTRAGIEQHHQGSVTLTSLSLRRLHVAQPVRLSAAELRELLPQNLRDLRREKRGVLLLLPLIIFGIIPRDPERPILAFLVVVEIRKDRKLDRKVFAFICRLALGARDTRSRHGPLALSRPDARVAVFHSADGVESHECDLARAIKHLPAKVIARGRVARASNVLRVHAEAGDRDLALIAQGTTCFLLRRLRSEPLSRTQDLVRLDPLVLLLRLVVGPFMLVLVVFFKVFP